MSIVSLILGIIPAKIAESKGKDFTTWYIYGVFLFFFAMIHAIVLPEKSQNNVQVSTLVKSVVFQGKSNDELNETELIDLNCPVEVLGYDIKVNENADFTYCGVNFLNLSEKHVASIKFIIYCFDSFGKTVENREGSNKVDVLIQDESAGYKVEFGLDKLTALPGLSATRKVNIFISEVLFNDGSIWGNGEHKLIKTYVDKISDGEELKNLKHVAGSDAICYAEEKNDTWTCVCSRINNNSNESCIRCDRSKEFVLKSFKNKECIKRTIELEQEKEKELVLEKKARLRKKRTLSIAFISILIIFSFIGFATQFTFSYKGCELKKYGVNPYYINSVLSDGSTYLSNAVEAKNTNMIDTLIKYGADINIKTHSGETPLHTAVYTQNVQLVKLLVGKSADINAKTNNGETPLHYAVKENNMELTKLLIENKANLNIKEVSGETPLNYAVNKDNIELAKLLIKSGADVNTRTDDGKTPIFYPAYNDNVEMYKLLVDNKADFDAEDNSGQKPQYLYRCSEMFDYLVEKGFYIKEKENSYRRTSKKVL
jgi:ankyrin repeat protein